MASRHRRESAAEELADLTDKPEADFDAEEFEIPELDDLDSVSES
ncbi:hypothetical protein [Halobaculum magnesiiphilum]|nr:hypothetical protein [Halobaculum magnesiiphilum]